MHMKPRIKEDEEKVTLRRPLSEGMGYKKPQFHDVQNNPGSIRRFRKINN